MPWTRYNTRLIPEAAPYHRNMSVECTEMSVIGYRTSIVRARADVHKDDSDANLSIGPYVLL